MGSSIKEKMTLFNELIESELKPKVKAIDTDALYAEDFLRSLGRNGFFSSTGKRPTEYIAEEMKLVEEVAKVCMTTAFCLWCHLAALTYLRHTPNRQLRADQLPALENGELLGATGLSNPMKYYAGLEPLHLKAKAVDGGYLISGSLSGVSNLGMNHGFGVIAEVSEHQRVMCFTPSSIPGLTLEGRTGYLGVNGSATYACTFNEVFIPHEIVISDDADAFIPNIRAAFLLYQIPLGIGVTKASIHEIERVRTRQRGCNQYLPTQATDLSGALEQIQQRLEQVFHSGASNWRDIVSIRLDTAYLTLNAVQTSMLHTGSGGYLKESRPSRQLREAYFFVNLTPTTRHLEKMMQS